MPIACGQAQRGTGVAVEAELVEALHDKAIVLKPDVCERGAN
jgi:hypothetical protein